MHTHLLTVNEVAERVRVNPRTVRRWIDADKLRAVRVMGNIKIESTEVDNLVKTEVRPDKKAKNRPDMDAITDRIERMLAEDPHPSTSESISELIRETRQGREDVLLNRH